MIDQPLGVPGHEGVIDVEVFIKRCCRRRHHARPCHFHRYPFLTNRCRGRRQEQVIINPAPAYWLLLLLRLSTRTGSTGGRTDSARQPNKNSTAPPQTLPWHGPMPQRVCSFASRHER